MPDAVAHLVTARLAALPVKRPDLRSLLYVGVLWPDILSKGTQSVLRAPPGFDAPSHSFVGLAVSCLAFALLFAPGRRREAFLMLMGGSVLHLALDLLKDYGVAPGLLLFHPFSTRGFSLGLFRSENAALLIPGALAMLALIEAMVWWRRRRV